MAEDRPAEAGASSSRLGKGGGPRQAGLREVVLVGAGVVLTVLGAAASTSLLPPEVRSVVTDTPFVIVILLAGTALVLARVARTGRG